MTVNMANRNFTNDTSMTCLDLPAVYMPIDDVIVGRYVGDRYLDTASARASTECEEEIGPYELMCGSGALAFWDEPEEDIYSFEDGEAL